VKGKNDKLHRGFTFPAKHKDASLMKFLREMFFRKFMIISPYFNIPHKFIYKSLMEVGGDNPIIEARPGEIK